MWVIFCSNCVKVISFSILHIYAQADVIALRVEKITKMYSNVVGSYHELQKHAN